MKMIASFSIWLLAAHYTTVIAGPLPRLRHQFSSLRYSNTSLSSPSIFSTDHQSTLDFTSTSAGISASQNVEVDTAVVVKPIGHTVFTRTEAAITFVNPEGDPVVTQPEETVLSTSYITQPSSTKTLTPEVSPKASSVTPLETSTTTKGFGYSVESKEQTTPTPSGRLSTNTTASGTATQGPIFTYVPDEDTTEAAQPSASTITISSFITITQDSDSNVAQTTRSSCIIKPETNPVPTLSQSSIGASPNSETQSTVSSEAEPAPSSRRTIVVTSTEYTTLYPSSAASSQLLSEPSSQSPSSAAASEPPLPTLTRPSAQLSPTPAATELSNSSVPAPLPTSSLSPPPVVVITPSAGQSTEPATSNVSEPVPSSELPPSSSPTAAQSTSAGDSTGDGGGFIYPTQHPAASPDPLSASASASPSSSADVPPLTSTTTPTDSGAPSSSTPPPDSSTSPTDPVPAPSATSSGPLVVVPINTSQIFTVTVTETTTATEKETVTVTATTTA